MKRVQFYADLLLYSRRDDVKMMWRLSNFVDVILSHFPLSASKYNIDEKAVL